MYTGAREYTITVAFKVSSSQMVVYAVCAISHITQKHHMFKLMCHCTLQEVFWVLT